MTMKKRNHGCGTGTKGTPQAWGLALCATLVAGCSAAGGGIPQLGEDGLPAPGGLVIETANGALRIDWTPVPGATAYRVVYGSTASLTGLSPGVTVPAPPLVVENQSGTFFVAVASIDAEGQGALSGLASVTVAPDSPEKYFPSWANRVPTTTLAFDYDPGQTSEQNAASLAATIGGLLPGDRLEIGAGTYSFQSAFRISVSGTPAAPIWIVAKAGTKPVITRANNSQNALEIGVGASTRYLCLRGLEITGGDIGIRFHDTAEVWLDQCEVHHTAQNAIAANTLDVQALYFTRNEIHHTLGTGEGFYLGGNFSNPVASHCVVALNHVHDCGGSQGDGIEVKQGSFGNWIAENVVHDTNYPCILVYGTDGNARNVIERNVCWNSGDNVMQVQGEALVRNNVLFNGGIGFHSGDHQGTTRDLEFTHNTVVNSGLAVNLSAWSGRAGMRFTNNAVYSQTSDALRFGGGIGGTTVAGNVAFGGVQGAFSGYVLGSGLGDFTDVRWDGSRRDVTPFVGGALVGAADAFHAALDSLDGSLRTPAFEAGAAELR